MEELERQMADETSPLYDLMCAVVNGDRSDWMSGYGEPSHIDYLHGREGDYPERTGPCCWSGNAVYVPAEETTA